MSFADNEYERLEIEVVGFEIKDVVAASGGNDVYIDDEGNIYLPIVP